MQLKIIYLYHFWHIGYIKPPYILYVDDNALIQNYLFRS